MCKLNLTKVIRLSAFLSLWVPFFSVAQECRPQLHSDIEIDAESVIIQQNNNRFRIEPNGSLFVDVHPVSLSEQQKASLSAYSEKVRADLPYIGQSLAEELNTSWLALDGLIADELGDGSKLRGELGQYHQYLQAKVMASFFAPDQTPRLNHEGLEQAVKEIEDSVPQFIAAVSSRGLMDIANLSAGEPNKFKFISDKMSMLQNLITAKINEQRQRSAALRMDLCARLDELQAQESEISALIPALSGWKTVTVSRY